MEIPLEQSPIFSKPGTSAKREQLDEKEESEPEKGSEAFFSCFTTFTEPEKATSFLRLTFSFYNWSRQNIMSLAFQFCYTFSLSETK